MKGEFGFAEEGTRPLPGFGLGKGPPYLAGNTPCSDLNQQAIDPAANHEVR